MPAIDIYGVMDVTRVLKSIRSEAQPGDPLTFAADALVLAAVSLLASYIPARRAMKMDPIVALRHE